MPCTDGDPKFDKGWSARDREVDALNPRIEDFEAILCGALTALGGDLDKIDWQEVGMVKERAQRWWDKHRKADALRKAREALTPEELKLIGIE